MKLPKKTKTPTKHLTTSSEIFDFLGSLPEPGNNGTFQAMKIPNKRLVEAFGVTHIFLNIDIHTRFFAEGTALLHTSWSSFLAIANKSVLANLQVPTGSEDRVPIHMVRASTLETILGSLLPEVHRKTGNIVTDQQRNFAIAVCDILFPSIAECVDHVLSNTKLEAIMKDLHEGHMRGYKMTSPEDIYSETLRLCPPIQQIYYSVPGNVPHFVKMAYHPFVQEKMGYDLDGLVIADIASALRHPATWGADHDKFNPGRFFSRGGDPHPDIGLGFGSGTLVGNWSITAGTYITAAICSQLKGIHKVAKGEMAGGSEDGGGQGPRTESGSTVSTSYYYYTSN